MISLLKRFGTKALPDRSAQSAILIDRVWELYTEAAELLGDLEYTSRPNSHRIGIGHNDDLRRYRIESEQCANDAIALGRMSGTNRRLNELFMIVNNHTLQYPLETVIESEAASMQDITTMQRIRDRLLSLTQQISALLDTQDIQYWNDATIVRIAQQMLQDRNYDAAPILADALEEAGIEDEELTRVLRGHNQNAIQNVVRAIAGR